MLLINNDQLYNNLLSVYANKLEDKYLFLSLYDNAGNPLDNRIPSKFHALKKVVVLPDRIEFHEFGRNSFAIVKNESTGS